MTVRVVRVMEYTYPDGESAAADMERWAVQGTRSFTATTKIRSISFPPDFFYDEDES